jgi:hypothetical protein
VPTTSSIEDNPSGDRRAVVRRVAGLIAATGALVVLIVILGDVRRASNVLAQSRQKAAAAQERLTPATEMAAVIKALHQDPETQTGITFEYLAADARGLRDASTAILVANSPRVRRVFLSDGRGVVLFQGDTFSGRWVSEAEFQGLVETRAAVLARQRPGGN